MPRPGSATLPASGGVPRPLAALFALVLALAALGAYLAAGLIGNGDGTAAPPVQRQGANGFAVGDSVFTSFGAVAVETVEKNKGLTAKDLSGAVHGIQSLVPRNKAQVQLFSTMTNLTGKTVEYSPAQWSLLVGSRTAKPLPLSSASVKPGVLQPSAAIDMRLSFVVPRKGQKLWARFKDPGRAKPYLIDLGRITKAPQGALANSHDHK